MRVRSAFNDSIWAVPTDGHVPLPSPLPLARKSLALEMLESKRKAEELVDIQKIPHQDWLEFTETPDTIEHTDLISSEWVQKGPQCRSHDLDPQGEAAFYHPSFRFTQNAHAVRVQLEELRPGKPKEKIWDVIFAGGPGLDNEVLREDTPVGGKLPLFREFCQPLSEDTRWELRVTDVTPNKKGLETGSFDETLVLRPKGDLPRTYHLRKKGVPPPKKFSAEYWTRKMRKEKQEREAELMQGLEWPPRKPLQFSGDLPDGAVDSQSWSIDPETGKPVDNDIAEFL